MNQYCTKITPSIIDVTLLTFHIYISCIAKICFVSSRVFNVVIPRPTEEPGNKWLGESIKEGQEVSFRIVVLDLYGALPYIRGELDER